MSFVDFELIDIPIEFKEINPSDFDNKYYKVEDKIIIKPNGGGFIGDTLLPNLDRGFKEKNTVVINAGVGQGKSKAILEMAEKYCKTGEHIVIIAVPYNNLIEQYVKDCSSFMPEYQIFNLSEIEKEANNIFKRDDVDVIDNYRFAMSVLKIHVLTVNGLLGNSGEDSLFQAKLKVTYFNELQDYCKKKGKKLVVIFDEIHDSIHNFKEELIINLWNYQGLIHKIITVSATYNEASKEVIKYLSELTDRKIQIIESERAIVPERQSKLQIYFYSGMFVERDKLLVEVLSKCIKNPESLDIMAYSKSLVKRFLLKPDPFSKSKEVSDVLYPHKENINRCYADIFDYRANQKYHPNKINVGTNFTTGINIQKKSHNYVVILPKETNKEYFNNKGIFTNGANSVIQTLARQRIPGTIHVFMPQPARIDNESLRLSIEQKSKFEKVFNSCSLNSIKTVEYSNINEQKTESLDAYKSLLRNTSTARKLILETDRTGMNRLEFYPMELFNLYKAEKHLTQKFFGGNLSAFVLWASLCNQFLNCKLSSIRFNMRIDLKSVTLNQDIESIYRQELSELDNFGHYEEITEKGIVNTTFHHSDLGFKIADNLSSYELWEYFQVNFLMVSDLYVDNKKVSETNYLNQIHLILFSLITNNNPNIDKKILYYNHLKSCIHYSKILDLNEVPENFISERELKTIKLFKEWFDLVELLEDLKETNKKDERLPNTAPKEFIDLFLLKSIDKNIKELISVAGFLSLGMFPFKDTFSRIKSPKKMAESLYVLLVSVLYNGKLTSSTKNGKPIRFYKLEKIDFENSNLNNLLHKQLPEEIL